MDKKFKTTGIGCKSCVRKIEGNLEKIERIEVNLATEKVRINYD